MLTAKKLSGSVKVSHKTVIDNWGTTIATDKQINLFRSFRWTETYFLILQGQQHYN